MSGPELVGTMILAFVAFDIAISTIAARRKGE